MPVTTTIVLMSHLSESLAMSCAIDGRLPTEILDYAFSFLDGDKRTLSACSMVCKSWMASSYPLLYATLSLEATCTAFSNRQLNTSDSFASFAAFLSGSLLRHHVRSLRLSSTPLIIHKEVCPRHILPWIYIRISVLASIISMLPRLQELHITGPIIYSKPGKLAARISQLLFALEILRLDHAMTKLQLACLLGLFGRIGHLDMIQGVSSQTYPKPPISPIPYSPPPVVGRISSHNRDSVERTITFLTELGVLPHSLYVEYPDQGGLGLLAHNVAPLVKDLRRLEINHIHEQREDHEETRGLVALVPFCPKLEQLSMSIDVPMYFASADDGPFGVMLCALINRSWKQITLSVGLATSTVVEVNIEIRLSQPLVWPQGVRGFQIPSVEDVAATVVQLDWHALATAVKAHESIQVANVVLCPGDIIHLMVSPEHATEAFSGLSSVFMKKLTRDVLRLINLNVSMN